jgi:hypothetical protein
MAADLKTAVAERQGKDNAAMKGRQQRDAPSEMSGDPMALASMA